MLNGCGTCSERRSACLLIFSSFVSPPAETAFGARETCDTLIHYTIQCNTIQRVDVFHVEEVRVKVDAGW